MNFNSGNIGTGQWQLLAQILDVVTDAEKKSKLVKSILADLEKIDAEKLDVQNARHAMAAEHANLVALKAACETAQKKLDSDSALYKAASEAFEKAKAEFAREQMRFSSEKAAHAERAGRMDADISGREAALAGKEKLVRDDAAKVQAMAVEYSAKLEGLKKLVG